MFPLADARGRVVGFQARKLREDDPLRGKYVNSPEGDLFHKSAVLYGLHLAKAAIGKQDFAAVVEGNTDVIALRQAGFEPVVASMGTALTERQLRELGRLTKKLFLCFDADAAGQDATLRGMELAAGQGFDVKVVTLPRGQDPADAPDGFADRLTAAESYLVYRVRLEIERSADRQEGFVRAREVLAKAEDSPERQEALRLLADRLDLPRETLAGLAPARGGGVARIGRGAAAPRRGRPARARRARCLRRAPVARARARRALVRSLRLRAQPPVPRRRSSRAGTTRSSRALRAELDARAAQEALDERTGTELLLRLRERKLKRDLASADLARTTELQAHLAKVRQALAELTDVAELAEQRRRPRPRRRRAAPRSGRRGSGRPRRHARVPSAAASGSTGTSRCGASAAAAASGRPPSPRSGSRRAAGARERR